MRAQVFAGLSALALVLAPVMGSTQTREETLADVRQQLSVLYVEIQQLKRELSTTGAPGTVVAGASTLERVDVIEQQLQVLTNKTEELQYRVARIVEDGTNRIGDLEFRLVELEGGDLSQLGETTTLGGDIEAVPDVTEGEDDGSGDGEPTELAVGEETDFNRAMTALDNAEYASAADQFASFVQTYPGSPLESEAHLRRGQALEGTEDKTGAARAFLEAYSGAPVAGTAPEALFRLGKSLGALGQVNEACVTLNEVGVRFPGGVFVSEAQAEMANLQCH
ncbi:tetratricopeptide repeat protein [Shimia sp. R9_2]|uniref:tetratricopeptide repeat protein n=1 Tax=Shimia sp. R9_2 TaxID=2821112 RepID=UPI001ADC3DA1|nr:tetratricopeptide repeat protein [Shimia sp. R9_2]MBO9396727.1 tetratricopeptide repeat protein [Shimia sp. R9_2]